ncbi:MAG: flagellum-specific ATP synthase FliI, partial [Aeromonas sp.]
NASVSRVMPLVVPADHLALATRLRQLLGRYQQVRELLPLGGYQAGHDAELDEAVRRYPQLATFLRQGLNERSLFADSVQALGSVLA